MTQENPKLTNCPNCDQPLAAKDRYCRNCGQSTRDLRVPFKHLVFEALEGIFHIDNNFFRTIGALLFKPGLLTAEYVFGRRKQYAPPVRLYIFISFIFFLTLSINPGFFHIAQSSDEQSATQKNFFDSDVYNKSILSFNDMNTNELKGLSDSQIDSLLAAKKISPTWINKHMARRMARIGNAGRAEFRHQTHKGISYMMFFLMPVFGWILYLFYRKKASYYIDYLIFSIQFHSFVFLLFALYKITEWFGESSLVSLAVLIALIVYFLLASKKVFCQSWPKTIIKTILISCLYSILTVICMVIMLVLSVATF
jgi:hypothetical protein